MLRDKILKYDKILHKEQLFLDILFFVLGFILSFAKISGVMTSFCLSFAMSLKRRASFFCFLGSIFSITLFLTSENLIYIFILLLGLILKSLLYVNSSLKNAVLAAISFVVPNLVFLFFFPIDFYNLIMIYFQTILCASITALCTQIMRNFSFESKNNIYNFLGICILSVIILISLCNISVYDFNFGRLVCALIALQILLVYEVNFTAIFGMISIISLTLFNKEFAKYGVVVAIASFFASIFKRTGKIFQIVIFCFMYCFCCVFFGGFNIVCLGEVIVASAVCVFIPVVDINLLSLKRNAKDIYKNGKINDNLAVKLKFAADILLDLQNDIQDCAKVMDNMKYENDHNLIDSICDNVCKNCGLNMFCWITSNNELLDAFSNVISHVKKYGFINKQNLPFFLRKKCCKILELVTFVNDHYNEKICFEQNNRRMNEIRDIAKEQFLSVYDFLMEMSDEVKSIKNIDYLNSKKIFEILKKSGFKVHSLFCFLNEFGKITIDVYFNYILKDKDIEEIKEIVSDILLKSMSNSNFSKSGNSYKISFFEMPNFSVEIAVEQRSAKDNSCCGDSYKYFTDGKGVAHVILSDGMGNGKRAAIDSLMACLTFKKLIESGFGMKAALKILNLSFAVKSKEETFATIDSCDINLYSGDVKFLKAGASASYVKSDDNVSVILNKSLPVGIIRNLDFNFESIRIIKGDIIVMVSDGATNKGFDWIGEKLNNVYKMSPKTIANDILKTAIETEDEKHSDDITVIVVKVF